MHLHLVGGLGNQLFQLATAYAYTRINNVPFTCSRSVGGRRACYVDSFENSLDVYAYDHRGRHRIWKEPSFQYKEPLPPNLGCMQGWFQSSQYFNAYREEILKLFTFKEAVRMRAQERHSEMFECHPGTVVVHVRRGDFLETVRSATFDVVTPSYFSRAIEWMRDELPDPTQMRLYIFSDDLKWCMDQPCFRSENSVFVEEADACVAIYSMSQASRFILSNSSFSWWAAWLSVSAQSVAVPDPWFGPEGPHPHDTIYEPSWTRIPVNPF